MVPVGIIRTHPGQAQSNALPGAHSLEEQPSRRLCDPPMGFMCFMQWLKFMRHGVPRMPMHVMPPCKAEEIATACCIESAARWAASEHVMHASSQELIGSWQA